jgi:hypothetical protein
LSVEDQKDLARLARIQARDAAARSALHELVEAQGWPTRLLTELEPMVGTIYVTSLDLEYPGYALPFRPDMYHSLLVRAGLLPIGSCANGDIVVVDCDDPRLPVLYISHEEFDYEDASRQAVLAISAEIDGSIPSFLARADQDQVPCDYFHQ